VRVGVSLNLLPHLTLLFRVPTIRQSGGGAGSIEQMGKRFLVELLLDCHKRLARYEILRVELSFKKAITSVCPFYADSPQPIEDFLKGDA
jgi:hypothetical protein